MIPIVGKRYRCMTNLILPKPDKYHQPHIREEKIVTVVKKDHKTVEILAEYANGNEKYKIPIRAFTHFFQLTNETEAWKEAKQ